MQVGKEMCERFLKGEYQYFLAVHNDRDHIHLHVIFNNVNQWNGRTFETNENRRYTQKDRSYNKLRDISDKVCKELDIDLDDVDCAICDNLFEKLDDDLYKKIDDKIDVD